MKALLASIAAACAIATAAPASAAVIYTLSFENSGAPALTGGFTLTLPDFFSGDATFAAADLDSCNTNLGCVSTELRDDTFLGSDSFDYISFTRDGGGTRTFRFDVDAFETLGAHQTRLGSANIATLTVAMASAVPEPATWALAISGFAMVGTALRRRKPMVALPQ